MMYLTPKQIAGFLSISLAAYTYKKQHREKIETKINRLCIPLTSFRAKTNSPRPINMILRRLEKDFHESKNVTFHVNDLKRVLEKENNLQHIEWIAREIHDFIAKQRCISPIDVLVNHLFYDNHPGSKSFSELDGDKLLQLEPLFLLMNDYFCKIEDQKLKQEIKILFANLPYRSKREDLSHLYLDEKEQLEILLSELQKKEDRLVQELIDRLQAKKAYMSEKELALIEKMLVPKNDSPSFSIPTELSPSNRTKLDEAFKAYCPPDRHPVMLHCFKQYVNFKEKYLRELPESSLKILQRTSKSKSFFKHQLSLPDDQIRIPYWYHATNSHSIEFLISSQIIQMFVKKRGESGYTGAWVSSCVESHLFGKYVIGLSKNIDKLDNGVVRKSLMFSSQRWRGLMVSIPINHYASVFSIPNNQDKITQHVTKYHMAQLLCATPLSSYPYKIISEKQLCFIQKQVTQTLGHPNLALAYWKWTS